MELLDLRGAKWLWSGFGCQIHSTPIQKDHCLLICIGFDNRVKEVAKLSTVKTRSGKKDSCVD